MKKFFFRGTLVSGQPDPYLRPELPDDANTFSCGGKAFNRPFKIRPIICSNNILLYMSPPLPRNIVKSQL